jgi:hypothetical protein
MKKIMLNKEELEIEKEIEKGEWKPVLNIEEEIKRHKAEAHNYLSKKPLNNIT